MMALKDLLELADDKLHELWAKKPYDYEKERKAMIRRVDKARDQHLSATPTKGKKIFTVKNGVAQVTLPFSIAGKSTFHVPSERFVEWLDHLKDSLTKGELDKELEARDTQPGRTSTAPKTGAGWSPERRAKFDAKIAERRAAKK
ncbi:hypothetical protein P6144_00145 [Sphingomonas sp. HITSZ_GF]|uniref:hypothetical protein n=1 Tax=Sphingomonas sp. HITSZ_GF TaxID=3037247 RepID=UPI00240DD640|nr:hypothetical protein [Sphingomonas sp. HITSZ_GF]MDG2532045.1 hypothetical protein [Sphingomonas sp. HITSZ_GF]